MELHNVIPIETLTFIAGVLVPTTNINVTTAFNTPPTASISLPPYPQLYGIGRCDRIPVQVFIKETWVGGSDYILLFEGEVSSFGYSSSGISREIVVNAQSILTVLRDVNIKFLTSFNSMVNMNMVAGEKEKGLNTSSHAVVYPMSLFMKGISAAETGNLITSPSEYLKNAYNFLAETHKEKGFNDSNLADFYKTYAKKIRLPDRFVDVPYFDGDDSIWEKANDKAGIFPLIDGIQKAAAVKYLSRGASNAMSAQDGPVQGSVYDLLDYVVNNLEYEFAFFSSPRADYDENKLVSSCLKPILYEAIPPACNILFRPMVERLTTNEQVYQVPTRVRAHDIHNVLRQMQGGEQIANAATIDYYPTEKYKEQPPADSKKENFYTSDYLKGEQYTGTYLFETEAPSWLSYIDSKDLGVGTPLELRDRLLKHLLTIKRYEVRNLEVSGALNPYITPGFPGAVYDAEDGGFTFVGHVLTVNHSISKQGCVTTAHMGFARLVDEAISEPLENTVPKINEVTHDLDKMGKVYRKLLGCQAVTFESIKGAAQDSEYTYQANPKEAYTRARREIATLGAYLGFMGLSVSETMITPDGERVPSVLSGDYVDDRFNKVKPEDITPKFESSFDGVEEGNTLTGVRYVLKEIAKREFKNVVYTFTGAPDIETNGEPTNEDKKLAISKSPDPIKSEVQVEVPSGGEIGDLTAQFESGSAGAAAIGYDESGGTSYGTYQIASKTGTYDKFLEYCDKNDGQEVAERLRAAGKANTGSREGKAPEEWKKLAEEGKIQDLERGFIKETHYDPAYRKLEDPELQKRVSESPALQEALWSTSVQNGDPAGIFNKTYEPGMSDDDLVDRIYEERSRIISNNKSLPTATKTNIVQSRYATERKALKAMLAEEKEKTSKV